MADRKATLTAILVDSVSGPARQITATVSGIGESASKMNSILTGIGVGIGVDIFNKITNAVETLAHAIPDLMDAGARYLEQLHEIQIETGMTAEQTSLLVGITKSLGLSTDNLDPLFAKLGKNLSQNEGQFRALGVATRDANGNMLGAFQIIQNLREQVSKHGEALLSTAAAQELFGRGGYQLLPLLQMTDEQFKSSAESVERWGGIMSQQAIDGAHKFSVELASLQTGILDIGTNIFAALSPYLSAFVDAFSRFVQQHLQEIINFAVSVAATITGFIGGLLGFTVDFSNLGEAGYHAAAGTDTFGKAVKAAAGGQDAFTTATNAHIKAIDAQIAAESRAEQLRAAARERERLDLSLANAQSQLADLQGNAPFLGGLSGAEQALAVQKHAQDIKDAEKGVHDARTALADFEANQKDQAERELLNREKQRLTESLAAHRATNAAIQASGLQMGANLESASQKTFANIGIDAQKFGETARASFQQGVDAANNFLDVLLGAETVGPNGPVRTGGVVGALKGVGDVFSSLTGTISGFLGSFQNFQSNLRIGVLTVELLWLRLSFAFKPAEDAIGNFLSFMGAVTGFLRGLVLSIPGFGPAPAGHHASGGWVGMNGPELSWVGEKEPELIVPKSQMGNMLGGGDVHFHFDFLSMPSDAQIRDLTAKVSRRLASDIQHSPVTSKPYGAF